LARSSCVGSDSARVALPGRQSTAIIACLGLADGFSLARDRLADLVWVGRGEQADISLRQELATRIRPWRNRSQCRQAEIELSTHALFHDSTIRFWA
jgi:hypothetical protein